MSKSSKGNFYYSGRTKGNFRYGGRSHGRNLYFRENIKTATGTDIVITPRAYKNEILNSDFINTTGYTAITGTTIAVTSNVLTATGNGGSTAISVDNILKMPCISSNKLAIRMRARVVGTDSAKIRYELYGTTSGGKQVDFKITPVDGTWYDYFIISDFASLVGDLRIRFQSIYNNTTVQNGKKLEISKIIVINLTQVFGAGLEPISSWCDTNITYDDTWAVDNYNETGTKRDTGKITRVEGASTQVVTVQGKNYVRQKLLPITTVGITVTYDSLTDEYIINGTSTAGVDIYLLPNPTYQFNLSLNQTCSLSIWKISGTNSGTIQLAGYNLYDDLSGGSWGVSVALLTGDTYKTNLYTAIKAGQIGKIRINIQSGITYTNLRVRFQVEKGIATSWERFIPNSPSPDYISPINSSADNGLTIRSTNGVDTSDKVVTLPANARLPSLPNEVMDTIEPISGVMNYVQRVGRVILNGSESWSLRTDITNTNTSVFALPFVSLNNTGFCNKFKLRTSNIDEEYFRMLSSFSNMNISVFKTQLTAQTAVAFKTWLASNNVTVDYEPTTPIYTPMSDINIETYPSNTITSLSSVKPSLTVKYLEK